MGKGYYWHVGGMEFECCFNELIRTVLTVNHIVLEFVFFFSVFFSSSLKKICLEMYKCLCFSAAWLLCVSVLWNMWLHWMNCASLVSLFIWACALCVSFCNGSSGCNSFCNGSSGYNCFCNGSSGYNWPISNRPRWAWLTVGWSCHPACDPSVSLKSETSSSVM